MRTTAQERITRFFDLVMTVCNGDVARYDWVLHQMPIRRFWETLAYIKRQRETVDPLEAMARHGAHWN